MASSRNYQALPGFKDYKSAVWLIHRGGNRRVWNLGSDCILKESPYDSPAETPWDEDEIITFIQNNTNIPVPQVIDQWVGADRIHFILKEKIPGETLDTLWPTMSPEQKEKMADQTAAYLRELRELNSSYMGRVDKQPLYDQMLFYSVYPEPHGPFATQDQLWAAMVATITQGPEPHGPFATQDQLWDAMVATFKQGNGVRIPRLALDRLRRQMPESAPYTYTHGDLSLSNIIVCGGNVVGLVDWEWSGFFPVWWEYTKFKGGMPLWINDEWWELLEFRMDKHPQAFDFWEQFHMLSFIARGNPSPNQEMVERGFEVLKELMKE
jgi:aminoglycoside phosphotransferase